jgi:hypothetical protein
MWHSHDECVIWSGSMPDSRSNTHCYEITTTKNSRLSICANGSSVKLCDVDVVVAVASDCAATYRCKISTNINTKMFVVEMWYSLGLVWCNSRNYVELKWSGTSHILRRKYRFGSLKNRNVHVRTIFHGRDPAASSNTFVRQKNAVVVITVHHNPYHTC